MTKMKKFASITLAAMMSLSLMAPAMAQNNESSTDSTDFTGTSFSSTKNEYEMFKSLQASSAEELQHLGYSDTEIQEIKNLSYEDALYERAQLPTSELKALGYNDAQISFMKNYDGRPLTDDQIDLMSAEIVNNISIWPDNASENLVTCHYYWEWDIKPVVYGTAIKDTAVVAWAGLDSASTELPLEIITSQARAASNYYKNGTLYQRKDQTIHTDAWSSAHVIIPGSYNNAWAKSGYIIVPVQPAVSGKKIEKAKFAASYI